MNTKRIITWGSFIVIVGLIIWGMIAANNKAEREQAVVASPEEITEMDWVKGNATSTVILMEYSDFQCPACAIYFPLVERLFAESVGGFRFVYRHFPLSQHANAVPAAQATEVAGKQNKFWEMYEMIFTKQTDWENSKDAKTIFSGYAETLGLDMEKFVLDFDSKEIIDKINADQKSGLKVGVDSTPTFYLNGKKISPRDYEEFKKLINDAITTTDNS
ncbi:MAG: thioredoxin domain-containing protein [Patescibacteria group bacterium]